MHKKDLNTVSIIFFIKLNLKFDYYPHLEYEGIIMICYF